MKYFTTFKIISSFLRAFFIFSISDIFSRTHPSRFKVYWLTFKAFFYGYPLILMDKTCQVMTATTQVVPPNAPINQFAHMQKLPDYTTKDIIVCPNVDTLYSIAWLDLSHEPIILSLPTLPENRYYLIPLLDAWTNVFKSLGTRTTGNHSGNYVIIGPHWQGKLPENFIKIYAPTNMVWILGRTLVDGPHDCNNIINIQNQYKLTPLSVVETNYSTIAGPPVDQTIDTVTLPSAQVSLMNEKEFFTKLCRLMQNNPPALADESFLNKLSEIGIEKNQFQGDKKITSKTIPAFKRGYADAKRMLNLAKNHLNPRKIIHGWQRINVGKYDTHYFIRAAVAQFGLGANLPEDTIYYRTFFDDKKKLLIGTKRYILNFPSHELPPVQAFWSLTLYNSEHFLVQNPIQRYALSNRDNMEFNADGSLDIIIQQDAPTQDIITNWLPAPPENFVLILRLYWPTSEVINNQWLPPSVKQV